MKLILTREVAGLGTAGDVVTVKDGFARNFLLPRGNAIAWSLGGEKQIESIRRARSVREVRDIDHAKEIKAKLEAATVVTKVKVGAKGALFGSVTDKDVASAIKSATGLDIDRHAIATKGHIKKLGAHEVKITLGHNVTAKVSVSVVADK
jgi:large subunit ribosomal protein L9